MEKNMEKEKNIIQIENYIFKGIIYLITKEEKKHIIQEIKQNLKGNFYLIHGEQEKDMMIKEISYMN